MDLFTPLTLKGTADRLPGAEDFWYTGPEWLDSMNRQWREAIEGRAAYINLDLSNINFVTLNAWVITMAIIERVLNRPTVRHFTVDLKGSNTPRLMSWDEYSKWKGYYRQHPKEPWTEEFKLADRVYPVLRFLESVGTSACLNGMGFPGNFGYLNIVGDLTTLKRYFTGHPGREKVIMPLVRIGTRDSCAQFFYPERILGWRTEMAKKRHDSPLFATKQLWRVFCHELALNIYEHTHAPGYISIRVTEAEDLSRTWTKATYSPPVHEHFAKLGASFVELCASDCGDGFTTTLRNAFESAARRPPNQKIPPFSDADVLAFAFDELGTCKAKNDCWASGRHGLGRILQMVSVYGGALQLQSGNCEVLYIGDRQGFQRVPFRLGYKPTEVSPRGVVVGSHLRVYLPLTPIRNLLPNKDPDDNAPLPVTFKPDKKHVQGFLIPVREALDQPGPCDGMNSFVRFREACERLAARILNERARKEVLVFDFSGTEKWSIPQYESFLTWMGNVLAERQVLLIEVDADTANTIDILQFNATEKSQIPAEVTDSSASVTGKAAGIGEDEFLGGMRTVSQAVLCVDSRGIRHVFGSGQKWFAELLLGLIKTPLPLDKIEAGRSAEDRALLTTIFQPDNPLVVEEKGTWRVRWSDEELKVERERALLVHFDQVAVRCEAWRGRKEQMAFYLPFHNVWYREFLESSRILSRQRQADEIALHLLYRLSKRLEKNKGKLADVTMFVAVTGPALLLATALHRMWPVVRRPAVADLGNYQMGGDVDRWPRLSCGGKLVIVQDVFDEGLSSAELARSLNARGIDVLCCVGLGRFVTAEGQQSTPTDVDEWWDDLAGLQPVKLSAHALVKIPRTPQVHDCNHDTPGAHWVEPRSLRPFKYATLRREGADKDERKDRSRPLFTPIDKRIICAGHYVLGRRHRGVALDIRKAIKGPIGRQVAQWVAALCINEGKERNRWSWESNRGFALNGAVTAVLLPLHSQIHYLWPQIEHAQAIAGKRVPAWLLDSTLFLGHGPACRLPYQFAQQIEATIKDIVNANGDEKLISSIQLRLLILDDAVVSGGTAETLLGEVHRLVQKILFAMKIEKPGIRPIKWIRYFTLFNGLGEGKHRHWRGLKQLGIEAETEFIFEEYHSVVGIPIFEADHCPVCHERDRLRRVQTEAEFRRADPALEWAQKRAELLRPMAIDGPNFHQPVRPRLPIEINLQTWTPTEQDTVPYKSAYADEAILRFYELMYLSYPISDILPCLDGMAARQVAHADEYNRFRWAVFEWCLNNWSRLNADAARAAFSKYTLAEIEAESEISAQLLSGLAVHRDDPYVKNLVWLLLNRLAACEAPRGPDQTVNTRGAASFLDEVLTIFLLSISPEALRDYKIRNDNKDEVKVIDYIQMLSRTRVHKGVTFTNNIYLRFGKSHRYAEPGWAMHVIAESLFREPDGKKSSHRLLQQLLHEVAQRGEDPAQNRRLLISTLGNFVGALSELEAVAPPEVLYSTRPKEDAINLLAALRGARDRGKATVEQLANHLIADIQAKSAFCKAFADHFQVRISILAQELDHHFLAARKRNKFMKLRFRVAVDEGLADWSLLINYQHLYVRLANWTIDAAVQKARLDSLSSKKGSSVLLKSRIVILRNLSNDGLTMIQLRILSNWASPDVTDAAARTGRNFPHETQNLKMFDAVLAPKWEKPTQAERDEKFSAAFNVYVHRGYIIQE